MTGFDMNRNRRTMIGRAMINSPMNDRAANNRAVIDRTANNCAANNRAVIDGAVVDRMRANDDVTAVDMHADVNLRARRSCAQKRDREYRGNDGFHE